MGVIEPEQLELLPLNSKNFYVSLCLHCSIYNYQPVSSKLGQNIYDFVEIYMRCWMSSIMDVIRPEQPEQS